MIKLLFRWKLLIIIQLLVVKLFELYWMSFLSKHDKVSSHILHKLNIDC